MLVKINTSILASAAVALATSPNIGASAGLLRKTSNLAENDAAFMKDDEDAGVLDDVFTNPKKKQDPVVTTGIANNANNANSKATTTTVTLSEDSNVVHPNDDEAKKDNQDIRVLTDEVFTNTKKELHVATIANAGSKATTTTITKDSGMKKKAETSNVEEKGKKDIQDLFIPGNAKAGVVMKDGRQATVASPVDINIEAEEMMTRSKGTDMVEKVESNDDESKVKEDAKYPFVSGSDATVGVVMKDGGRAAVASPVDINIELKETTTTDSKGIDAVEKVESDIVEDKVKKDVHDSAFDSSNHKSIGMTESRRHLASTNHVRTKEESTDGTLKDLELKEEFESDVVGSKTKKDVLIFASDSSENKSIGKTASRRHMGSTNQVHSKEESTDGTLKDSNSMKEVESDVVPSVMAKKDVREKSGLDLSDLSDGKSNVGKDDSIMPNLVEQDSGIMPRSLHDDSPPAKMNLRRIFDPFHDKNAHKFSDDQLYRMLASCTGSGACMNSSFSCVKNRSCSGDNSCRDSPYLLVEEDACSGPGSCSSSPGLAVGMGSCTGGYPSSEYYSCFKSPNGCIGQRSCLGEENGACKRSPGIVVGDDSCLYDYACFFSPGATIKKSSCDGYAACRRSPNITVDKYSCRDNYACSLSPGATIGKYACNCYDYCLGLNESCVIPNYKCNGAGPEGDCLFSSTNRSCPDFS